MKQLTRKKKIILRVSLLVIPLLLVAGLLIVGRTSAPTPYAVQSGDTVFGICQSHAIRRDDLMKANPDLNPRRLHVGQTLMIPHTPLLIRLGRKMDRLARKIGFDNPPFTDAAYKLTREEAE
ncbi:LysM peptidoglycan-binding domain-containing protein [bacterium]|nr:LysM peptidoglycan-binding domain-containing protein [bacterium]